MIEDCGNPSYYNSPITVCILTLLMDCLQVSEMSDTVVKSNESILSLTNNSKSPPTGHHSKSVSSGHHSRAPTHIHDESASNNQYQYQSTGDTALSAIEKSDLQDRDDDDDDGGGVEVEDMPPLPPLPPPPSPDVS